MSNLLKQYITFILTENKDKNKNLYIFGFVDSLYNYRKDKWNERVVSDISKAASDPNGITVLCTARAKEEKLVKETMKSLASRGIKFDHYFFRDKNFKGTTPQYKTSIVKKMLKEDELIGKVFFWDDREDVLIDVKKVVYNKKYTAIKVTV